MSNFLLDSLRSLFGLLFPRRCPVCGGALAEGEALMCRVCDAELPRTGFHRWLGNTAEQMFWGKFEVGHVSCLYYYRKKSPYAQLVHLLKYGGRKDLGLILGRRMAEEVAESGFFVGIDLIIPVPLHEAKHRSRGYNQSELLAIGVQQVTGIPVDTSAVVRTKHTETQTRKSRGERWENVDGIFRVEHPERYAGKHLLLVDDVLTTGATTTACADAFAAVPGVRFSVLTLAMAR